MALCRTHPRRYIRDRHRPCSRYRTRIDHRRSAHWRRSCLGKERQRLKARVLREVILFNRTCFALDLALTIFTASVIAGQIETISALGAYGVAVDAFIDIPRHK